MPPATRCRKRKSGVSTRQSKARRDGCSVKRKPPTKATRRDAECGSDSDCLPPLEPVQDEPARITPLFIPPYRNSYLCQQVKAFASNVDYWHREHLDGDAPIVIAHKRDVKGLDPVWLVYTSSLPVMAQFLDGRWVVGNICQEPTLSQDAFVNHYLGRTALISAFPYRDTSQLRSLSLYDAHSFKGVYPPMSPPPLNNNSKGYYLPMCTVKVYPKESSVDKKAMQLRQRSIPDNQYSLSWSICNDHYFIDARARLWEYGPGWMVNTSSEEKINVYAIDLERSFDGVTYPLIAYFAAEDINADDELYVQYEKTILYWVADTNPEVVAGNISVFNK
ncbi:hypothetical protein P9112_009914 [Eukaryota sp. TZLM1-RC]